MAGFYKLYKVIKRSVTDEKPVDMWTPREAWTHYTDPLVDSFNEAINRREREKLLARQYEYKPLKTVDISGY